MCKGRPAGTSSAAGSGNAGVPWRVRANAPLRASHNSAWVIGLVTQAATLSSCQRCRFPSPTCVAAVSSTTGVVASAGCCLSQRATVPLSSPGRCASRMTTSKGCRAWQAWRRTSRAVAPLSTRVGHIAQWRSESCTIRRCVALSSTTSTFRPGRAAAPGAAGRCPGGTPTSTVQ